MKDRQRPPVLIIGAHRSGTTATARALELLGLQIGQRLDSHREPYGLQHLHENYLHSVGAAWHGPTPFLELIKTPEGLRNCVDYIHKNVREKFGEIFGYQNNPAGLWSRARLKFGARWGWKEPRTTLFAPAWLELFPDARIVQVTRDPMAAAISIRERELKFQRAGDAPSGKIDNLDYAIELVRRYVEAGENLANQTRNYRRVRFEDIQANAPTALEDLAHFCDLRFTSAQLSDAAATIRPQTATSPTS